MLGDLLRKLGELLLPERYGDQQRPSREPIDALISAYEQLFRLATQLEMHADLAPYPHIAATLRKIATENRDAAQRFRTFIEQRRTWIREPTTFPVAGKNHWERLQHDFAEQKLLENYLALNEPRLSVEYPEIADFLNALRRNQENHRKTLADLIAIADPQATQT